MSGQVCGVPACQRPRASKGYCRMHAERVRRNGHPELIGRPRRPMADRLWEKVDRSAGPDGCWPFTGRLHEGYGQVRTGVGGEPTIGAHRAAFLLANPEVVPPETVDHLCHDPSECRGGSSCPHRSCCNPAHLAAATVAENCSPDRMWTARRSDRCAAGHEWDEANTRWWTNAKGQERRICRACDRRRAREGKAS